MPGGAGWGRMGRSGEGLNDYYKGKIEELEIAVRDKTHNLRRLEAQRNDLNTKGEPPVGDARAADWPVHALPPAALAAARSALPTARQTGDTPQQCRRVSSPSFAPTCALLPGADPAGSWHSRPFQSCTRRCCSAVMAGLARGSRSGSAAGVRSGAGQPTSIPVAPG